MTDTQTLTLAEFLLARIAEDEDRAQGDYPFTTWDSEDDDWAREPSGLSWHARRCGYGIGEMSLPCECDVPARVLAECEAKRRIVAEHKTIRAAYPNTTIEADPCCETCSAGGEYPDEYPCVTLRLLALPYAGHPDYLQEWRP